MKRTLSLLLALPLALWFSACDGHEWESTQALYQHGGHGGHGGDHADHADHPEGDGGSHEGGEHHEGDDGPKTPEVVPHAE